MITTAVAVVLYLLVRNNVQLHLPGTPTQDGGITSLAHVVKKNEEWLIFCGTKKGSLQTISLRDQNCVDHCSEINVTDGKYPIFSLAVNEDGQTVFCGGSDRFVTILQQINAPDDPHDTTTNRSYYYYDVTQRLGPHTGWVQDVMFVAPNQLYSIGCNCIESWQQQSNQVWTQGQRFVVDSDIELGCTLSSDLLCLAYRKECLFAGGVDGRIHVFRKGEHSAFAAHSGRVNALITSITDHVNHLVSVSHDGWVHKWRYELKATGDMRLAHVHAFQSKERNTAVLSLQLHNASNEEIFVVGTNQGTILLLSNSVDLLGTYHLPQTALITAFLHIPHSSMVLVAHSLGLGAFHYDEI